jgi:hypothetical protein
MWRDHARDSVHPLRSLFDAAARGYSVKLACRACRHAAVLDAHALWWHFHRHGRDGALRAVARHCKCSKCGRRGPLLDLVHDALTVTDLPMPPLHHWKAELRRHR